MARKQKTEKFCGNCQFHSVYKYPLVIFCFKKFQQGESGVMSTLDRCGQWVLQSQECFCVRDALEKRNLERP
jgi:hypothetical protein